MLAIHIDFFHSFIYKNLQFGSILLCNKSVLKYWEKNIKKTLKLIGPWYRFACNYPLFTYPNKELSKLGFWSFVLLTRKVPLFIFNCSVLLRLKIGASLKSKTDKARLFILVLFDQKITFVHFQLLIKAKDFKRGDI